MTRFTLFGFVKEEGKPWRLNNTPRYLDPETGTISEPVDLRCLKAPDDTFTDCVTKKR
jgi:hypothetical protein